MAGFETIVRPVVFPNIRPQRTRPLLPQEDPEEGKAVIGGSGGGVISLSYTLTQTAQVSRPTETERRVDEMRVYQPLESRPPRPAGGGGGGGLKHGPFVQYINVQWFGSLAVEFHDRDT